MTPDHAGTASNRSISRAQKKPPRECGGMALDHAGTASNRSISRAQKKTATRMRCGMTLDHAGTASNRSISRAQKKTATRMRRYGARPCRYSFESLHIKSAKKNRHANAAVWRQTMQVQLRIAPYLERKKKPPRGCGGMAPDHAGTASNRSISRAQKKTATRMRGGFFIKSYLKLYVTDAETMPKLASVTSTIVHSPRRVQLLVMFHAPPTP